MTVIPAGSQEKVVKTMTLNMADISYSPPEMRSKKQQVYVFFAEYISRFLSENEAALYIANELSNCRVGLMPLIGHCTLRTLDVDKRAEDLFPLGFSHD